MRPLAPAINKYRVVRVLVVRTYVRSYVGNYWYLSPLIPHQIEDANHDNNNILTIIDWCCQKSYTIKHALQIPSNFLLPAALTRQPLFWIPAVSLTIYHAPINQSRCSCIPDATQHDMHKVPATTIWVIIEYLKSSTRKHSLQSQCQRPGPGPSPIDGTEPLISAPRSCPDPPLKHQCTIYLVEVFGYHILVKRQDLVLVFVATLILMMLSRQHSSTTAAIVVIYHSPPVPTSTDY